MAVDWRYTYDVENRLTQAHKNGLITEEYVYDYLGRRISKVGKMATTR